MITPSDFLEYATYNRLFDSIPVPQNIAAWLKTSDICYIEETEEGMLVAWYPIANWTKEKARREKVQRKIEVKIKKDKKQLMNELLQATLKQDQVRMKAIMEELKTL